MTLYPRGTYSKVARLLKVTPQHVRLVALGKVTSKRVAVALARLAEPAKRAPVGSVASSETKK